MRWQCCLFDTDRLVASQELDAVEKSVKELADHPQEMSADVRWQDHTGQTTIWQDMHEAVSEFARQDIQDSG